MRVPLRGVSIKQVVLATGIAGAIAIHAPAAAATFVIFTSDNPKAPVTLSADSSRGSISQTGTQSALITINGPAGTTAKGDSQTITDSFEVAASNGVSLTAQGSTTEPFSGPPVMFIEIQSFDWEGDPLTCSEGEIGVCTLKEAAEGSIVELGKIIWSDGSFDTVYLQPPMKRAKPPKPPSVPVWFGSVVRLSLTVAGPITPPPGSPVEATVGLTDINGNFVSQLRTAALTPGQVTSIDFATGGIAVAPGQHISIVPVVTAVPNAFLPPLELTAEVFDNASSAGAMLTTSLGFQDFSAFSAQRLAAGQVMRIAATASTSNPCAATLSFADLKGNRIGPSLQINVMAGQSMLLDLDAASLSIPAGQDMELQPLLTVPSNAGIASTPSCVASSEVFDRMTGRTRTYQTALY